MFIVYERRLEVLHQLTGTNAYFDAYKAVEENLDRPVFLKVAKAPDNPVAAQIVEAHVRQWRALAGEIVPNMPRVLDIGRHAGRWFMLTDWVESPSLASFITHSGLIEDPGSFTPRLLERCLKILAGLHGAGFVHGDISFGNILTDSQAKTESVYLVDPRLRWICPIRMTALAA